MGSFKLGKMTLGSIFKKPETIQYPVQTRFVPEGLKGNVLNDIDVCILCGICSKRCPTGAIEVSKPDSTWSIDRFRRAQCGSCIRECPKSCLSMDPHWPACATTKSAYVLVKEQAEKPERPARPERPKATERKKEIASAE